MIVEGRKNGKTTEIAAMEIDLLVNDGEGAPEIYNIATKREQAGKAFEACCNMRQQSLSLPVLSVNGKATCILLPTWDLSACWPAQTNSLDGLNAHGILIDELAAIKTARSMTT